jgi:phosphoglycolate phosphatase-like HAD superfamily hydrolase
MTPLNFRVIIFDFDGVIIESAGIKKESYRQLFEEEFPEHLHQILAYQETWGGLPRRRQFEEIYEKILNEEPPRGRVSELEASYVSRMLSRVVAAPLVPGVLEFLEAHHGQGIFFIASATPEDELHHIVRERGLNRFFVDVYGSPMRKAETLRLIGRKTGAAPGDMVFVGDYPTDRDAAAEVGIPFVARLGSITEMNNCPHQLNDLTELTAVLEGMGASR